MTSGRTSGTRTPTTASRVAAPGSKSGARASPPASPKSGAAAKPGVTRGPRPPAKDPDAGAMVKLRHAPAPIAAPADKWEYTVVVAVKGNGSDKEFLMVRHRERGWELPGGRLEAKEGPVHCALREFREETGHLLGDPKFVLKLHKSNGTCYVFTGTLGPAAEGKVEPSTEAIQEWRWFKRLPRGEPLAFPDDPYEEMGAKLGITFG